MTKLITLIKEYSVAYNKFEQGITSPDRMNTIENKMDDEMYITYHETGASTEMDYDSFVNSMLNQYM